ncbi:hypothetical protein ACJX0J_030547, partial [Zea mays]
MGFEVKGIQGAQSMLIHSFHPNKSATYLYPLRAIYLFVKKEEKLYNQNSEERVLFSWTIIFNNCPNILLKQNLHKTSKNLFYLFELSLYVNENIQGSNTKNNNDWHTGAHHVAHIGRYSCMGLQRKPLGTTWQLASSKKYNSFYAWLTDSEEVIYASKGSSKLVIYASKGSS